jgi:hypothetical protein
MAIGQVTVPYIGGYDFGVGADFATGSPMGKVVDGPYSPVESAPGSIAEFKVQRIQSTEELEQALGIDAEATYGSGSFGPHVSARFSFAKKAKIQSSSLFMSVTCHVELAFLSIDDPVLSRDAQTLVNDPGDFKGRYGNAFVRGIGRGGLFVGTLRVETGSSEESQQISAELQGSYGMFSGDVRGKFENLQKKYRASTFFEMYHEGGPIDLHVEDFSNPVELLKNANLFLDSFKTEPREVAVPYFVTLAPVTIAQGPPPPDPLVLEHAQDVLVACSKARSRLLDNINLLEYILDNSSKFEFTADADRSSVQTALKEFQTDLDRVAQCASVAMRSPDKATRPELKATLPDHLPLPKAAKMVEVPDFTGCESWVACNAAAVGVGLTAEESKVEPGDHFKVLIVTPPTGTAVPEGTKVMIVTQPAKEVPVKSTDKVFEGTYILT